VHKASVLEPLLNQLLGFIGSQVGNVNIIDQRKVNVSRTTDSRLGSEIGHSVNGNID
jgi:hypothetical protein